MAPSTVRGPVTLRLPQAMMAELEAQLFPGDGDEHGAVIGAAVVETGRGCRLLGRRLFLAADGADYVPSQRGYRMLTADFVRRCALACADEGLAYLAVHNHPGTDCVAFSSTDMASHRRGYPALVDILNGPPVGGLVFARQAVAGDIWASADHQTELDHTIVVGRSLSMRYPSPRRPRNAGPPVRPTGASLRGSRPRHPRCSESCHHRSRRRRLTHQRVPCPSWNRASRRGRLRSPLFHELPKGGGCTPKRPEPLAWVASAGSPVAPTALTQSHRCRKGRT